jgi:hypothetical protein
MSDLRKMEESVGEFFSIAVFNLIGCCENSSFFLNL